MECTKLEELQSVYSDLYKDVNGIRPRNVAPALWNSEEELLSEINWLSNIVEREIEFERHQEIKAQAEAAEQARIEASYKAQQHLTVSLVDFFRKVS